MFCWAGGAARQAEGGMVVSYKTDKVSIATIINIDADTRIIPHTA